MKTKVRIDVERVKSDVSPMIFGQFIEHMGRAIYGGVYEPGNSLSDEDGFRLDVIEKIKELSPPVLRWPGGNFASGYHWMDGIGPKGKRPKRLELAWQTVESNQFGTHEFIELCRRIGTEPYICVNLGWGSPEEATNWLEYCNSDTDTYFANLRRENGSNEPFNVKFWGLGNEIYGTWQHGHCEPEEYAHKAAEAAKMMKRVEYAGASCPIKFIICGANNYDWDRRVLEYFYKKHYEELADFISLHRYDGGPAYYDALFATMEFEKDILACKGLIEGIRKHYRPKKLPKIAFDEWNVWFRKTGNRLVAKKYFREGEDLLDELYCLRDALYVGTILNIFIRHCDIVEMANMAQLVNVIAPIFATPKGSYYQPIFYPLKYYRMLHKEFGLDIWVESEKIAVDQKLIDEQVKKYKGMEPEYWADIPEADIIRNRLKPYLDREFPIVDVSATRDREGKEVVISIVNRDESNDREVEVDLLDFAAKVGKEILITGSSPMECAIVPSGPSISDNEYNDRACYVEEKEIDNVDKKFVVNLPAHSIKILVLKS